MRKIIRLVFCGALYLMVPYMVMAQDNPNEIGVIAKRFDFLPRKIEVKRGELVKIYITSIDVAHGFAIDTFGIDEKVEKGKLTIIEFTPDKTGEFEIKCSIFLHFF